MANAFGGRPRFVKDDDGAVDIACKLHAAMFVLMDATPRAPRQTQFNSPTHSRTSTICQCSEHTRFFSMAWRALNAAGPATVWRTCGVAPN
jgi:hypothetical protein